MNLNEEQQMLLFFVLYDSLNFTFDESDLSLCHQYRFNLYMDIYMNLSEEDYEKFSNKIFKKNGFKNEQ